MGAADLGRVRSGAQPLEVRITPFRMSKGIMALLSPIIFAVVPVFMTDANESFYRFITIKQ